MATKFKTVILLSATVLAIVALGACGGDRGSGGGGGDKGGAATETSQVSDVSQPSPLFSDNFKGVCSGATVSTATAYVPGAKTHKALYFGTYKDGFTDKSSSLPKDWTVLFSPEGDALKAIDLVVCARRSADREIKVCDGYKNHGKPTENKVRWHTATYELSVREATTGKKLAETTIEATDSDCPMFVMFDSNSGTVDDYASLSDSAVADFLRPHITG